MHIEMYTFIGCKVHIEMYTLIGCKVHIEMYTFAGCKVHIEIAGRPQLVQKGGLFLLEDGLTCYLKMGYT